jgi:hypothetical protein
VLLPSHIVHVQHSCTVVGKNKIWFVWFAGLYQLTAAVAGQVLDMSDPTAYWGCFSASAAAVVIAGLQIRSSFTVDPER